MGWPINVGIIQNWPITVGFFPKFNINENFNQIYKEYELDAY